MGSEQGFDMQGILDSLAQLLSKYGLRVLGALAVLIIGRMIAGAIRRAVRRAMERSSLDATLVPFLSGMVYWLVMAGVVIAALQLFGVDATAFIAVLGAAGLAVGLALQGTLGNFAAGVMLLIFRPFKIGDFVEAGGVSGTVDEIGIFSTTLHSPDNVRVSVPNGGIYGGTVKNFSANDTRRNDLVIGIGYSDDIGKAIEVIERIVHADERVLAEPAAVIAVAELADSSVNIVVRPWCKREDYWALRFHLTRTLKEELEAAGCSIPFPQTDVHLHQST